MISAVKKSFIQPMRFALAGGLATASHWLVMALAINLGTAAITATAIGAFIGAVVNYILQRNVTFQSTRAHRSTLLRYSAVCTLTWTANLFFFFILNHIIRLTPMFAQGVTTLMVALMSYVLYKRIVFNGHQSEPVY